MDFVLALAREGGRSFCTRQLVLGRGFDARVLEASFQQLIGSESLLEKLVLNGRSLDAFPSLRLARTCLLPLSGNQELISCCYRSCRPSPLDKVSYLD